MKLEKATFGAGCFWGVEARFVELPGVLDTAAGYAGGELERPSYEDVCAGNSGHAEVVEVTFRLDRLTYGQLLDAFFAMHNPTQPYLKAGTPDRSQYRSLVLTHTPEQQAEAEARIAELNASGKYPGPIATQVMPAGAFWRAEEHHQRYLEKRNLR